jgi:hypothetical protein
VFDERQLQGARERPQLADRQRRDRLKGGDEALQALGIEARRTPANELRGEDVDPCLSAEIIGGEFRQAAEERGRQVAANVARRGRDDEVVVEQPLGGR